MDSILIDSFVSKSKGTLLVVKNLQRDSTPRYTHISSVIKHILGRYEQPYEFSEFPRHILRHIFLAKSILLSTDDG